MGTITDKFVQYLYDLTQQDFSDQVKCKSKEHLIDYLAAAYGGAGVNRKVTEEIAGDYPGDVHVIGYHKRVSMDAAILLNAFNAHVLELDDGHRNAMMHLAAPIFSGLLAVAEKKEKNLADLLKGAVIGYETAVRLGTVIQPSHKRKGFHATGTCGAIGTAMGIAAMLGYDKAGMKNVLSAAATSASGLLEVITGQSEQKPYNVAQAAAAGTNAALFGKYFSGPEDVLGGPRGFIKCFSDKSVEEELTKPQEKLGIWGAYMKPYAACRHCHAPIEAALNLRKEYDFAVTDIEAVVVTTYELAVYGHDHWSITSVGEAKMSIPYSVAAALLYHTAGADAFTEDKFRDSRACELARKVKVVSSEELTALTRERRAAIVTIHLQDGRIWENRVDYPKGEPENPISQEELEAKFVSLVTSAGYSEPYCTDILKRINGSEPMKIRDLLSAMER
ncbi:MAG: MmgE/PrpD family protein [Roseburia sp.]|nr:MmgE/PrpD family protein [Roseburia sp.]